MLRDVAPDDPFALLDAVVRGVSAAAFREEALFRTIVRATIDRWFSDRAESDGVDGGNRPVRQTRRFDYLAPVLAATGLPEPERTRLSNALALLFGAESVVVMRDVCDLDPDEAVETMAWAAATLLRGALAGTE
jgi:hypothetical protein